MAFEYTLLIIFAVGIYLGWMLVWSFHFIAIIYAKYKFYIKTLKPIDKDKLPGVSIIKPLLGVDDNLFDNLETFFKIDYPTYELLFCVQENTDPAIGVVKCLIEKYPQIDAKLFTGGQHVGINPKINNMIQGYEVAKYDLFMISDAGLRIDKDTLTNMVSLMTDKVGLVHQLPYVSDRKGFSANLEKVYFGTCQSRMYLVINCLGINCVTGMSCLMRKKVIDDAGGLKVFGNYIAEDYFLAKEFLSKGWILQLAQEPVIQNSATYSVSLWQNRMIRWCKLRLKLNIMSWLEPFQECFLIGIFASWSVNFLFNWNSLVFFLIHVLCWFLSDYVLLKSIQGVRVSKLPFSKFDYVIIWLYRETICYYLFLQAFLNPTVNWRHGTYKLKWGGIAEEIDIIKKQDLIKSSSLVSISSTSNSTSTSTPPPPTTITTTTTKQSKALIVKDKPTNTIKDTSTTTTTATNTTNTKQHSRTQSQPTSTLSLIQQIPSNTSILPIQQTNSLILNI